MGDNMTSRMLCFSHYRLNILLISICTTHAQMACSVFREAILVHGLTNYWGDSAWGGGIPVHLSVYATLCCTCYMIAVPVCEEGDVRLVPVGNINGSGRVEMCLDREWRIVGDETWGVAEATVVCRQLGLPTDGQDYSIHTSRALCQ